jgi:hypothetical protein
MIYALILQLELLVCISEAHLPFTKGLPVPALAHDCTVNFVETFTILNVLPFLHLQKPMYPNQMPRSSPVTDLSSLRLEQSPDLIVVGLTLLLLAQHGVIAIER